MTILNNNGPLYFSFDGSMISGSGQPNSRIVPTTQVDLEYLTFQEDMDPSRFVDRTVFRKGGHSLIKSAYDTETGRVVALKRHFHAIPAPGDAENDEQMRKAETAFRSDARSLGKLSRGHPGIVDTYGSFIQEEEGEQVPYLVMKLIKGNHLGKQLQREGPFSEKKAREAGLSIGSILEHIHTGNGRLIIYRDLKLENIFPMPEDAPWPYTLVDFSEAKEGVATYFTGSVLGTPGFNSPEIWGHGEADQTADIYSLGRIIGAMVTKDLDRFHDTWLGALNLEGLRAEGAFPVSDDFLRVIEKATARERGDRYQSALEMTNDLGYKVERVPQTRAELEAILGGNPIRAQTPQRREEPEITAVQEVGSGGKVIAARAKAIYNPKGKDHTNHFISVAREVGGNQLVGLNLGNVAREVGGNQLVGLNLMNVAREVGKGQTSLINLGNYAREVGGAQGAVFNLMNVAREVGKDQWSGFNLVNYAREVGGDQWSIGNLVNYAREVGGDQWYSFFNVAGKIGLGKKKPGSEDEISKQIGLVNYAGRGKVNQKGLLNIRGSGPWYNRISPFYGRLRTEALEEQPESSASLEEKAREGDVMLDREEKRHIAERARNYAFRSWAPVALGSAGAAIYYAFDGDPINNLYWVSLGGLISSFPLFFGSKSLFNKHLKNRALKQKRLAAGPPAKVEDEPSVGGLFEDLD